MTKDKKPKLLVIGASNFVAKAILVLANSMSIQTGIVTRNPKSLKSTSQNVYDYYEDPYNVLKDFGPDIVINTSTIQISKDDDTWHAFYMVNVCNPLKYIKSAEDIGQKLLFVQLSTLRPIDSGLYSRTKKLFSEEIRYCCNNKLLNNRIRFVNLLITTLYGPNDKEDSLISYCFRGLLEKQGELEFTSGKQKRDYLHISDFIALIRLLITYHDMLNWDHSNFNEFVVRSGKNYQVRWIIEQIRELTNSSEKVLIFGAKAESDWEYDQLPEASRDLEEKLCWIPKVKIRTGLEECLLYYKEIYSG